MPFSEAVRFKFSLDFIPPEILTSGLEVSEAHSVWAFLCNVQNPSISTIPSVNWGYMAQQVKITKYPVSYEIILVWVENKPSCYFRLLYSQMCESLNRMRRKSIYCNVSYPCVSSECQHNQNFKLITFHVCLRLWISTCLVGLTNATSELKVLIQNELQLLNVMIWIYSSLLKQCWWYPEHLEL